MTDTPYYLTAREAAAALGITLPTLYAYTSRGQLRSEPVAGRARTRRYYRDDVERLKERQEVRRDPSRAAARGIRWGGPVLDSGITLIDNGRLYYRGHDAIALAGTATVEQVAALLWQAAPTEAPLFGQRSPLTPRRLAQVRRCSQDPFTLWQASLPIAAAADAAAHDLRPVGVRQTGARIVRLLATIIARRGTANIRSKEASHTASNGAKNAVTSTVTNEPRDALHRVLQAAWAPGRNDVADIIRTTLVLCADHELNVSAFTARCAASAGATPYDVVSAALATLKGYRHGGSAERVLAFVAAADTLKGARAALASPLRQGEGVAGFGHPLYPAGDPRARLLLELAQAHATDAAWRPFRNLSRAGADVVHDLPNLDFGLAAITRACGLPDHAPLILFALGRTIGWIAHAIEEYATGQVIRPRARYVGPAPSSA